MQEIHQYTADRDHYDAQMLQKKRIPDIMSLIRSLNLYIRPAEYGCRCFPDGPEYREEAYDQVETCLLYTSDAADEL